MMIMDNMVQIHGAPKTYIFGQHQIFYLLFFMLHKGYIKTTQSSQARDKLQG